MSFDSRILQSAGILSPDSKIMISPDTMFSDTISFILPSLKTLDFVFTVVYYPTTCVTLLLYTCFGVM